MMKKKRLGLGFVVEELTEEYDTTRNQLNNAIPSVRISKRCHMGHNRDLYNHTSISICSLLLSLHLLCYIF